MRFAPCASLILSFADGTSNRGTLAWAKHPAACDIAIPWTEYTFLVGDWCSEDVRPPDMSLLPNPLLLEGAYGMPSVIDYDDDDFLGGRGGPSGAMGRRFRRKSSPGVHQGATPVAYDVQHRQWADIGDSRGGVSEYWSRGAIVRILCCRAHHARDSFASYACMKVLPLCTLRQSVHS